MNRFKQEEVRKHRDARAGLSELEIKRLDNDEALKREVADLARSIHAELFPEEYDHMYDSAMDAHDRANGKNPMNAEYIAKVDTRRAEMGGSPLSVNGMPVSDDSWKVAFAEAEARVRDSDN